MEPGPGPNPWRDHLESRGEGVFHFCLKTNDRTEFHKTLAAMDVGKPYHIGYWPGGSYSYVATAKTLGVDLCIQSLTDPVTLYERLATGSHKPLSELDTLHIQ